MTTVPLPSSPIAADDRTARPVYAQARTSERWAVAGGEPAEDALTELFDRAMARDPQYPDRQRVRSTYLVEAGAPDVRTQFLRLREYLGSIDSQADGTAFLELKTVQPDGLKRKERIAVHAVLFDRLRELSVREALLLDGRTGAEADAAVRMAALLQHGFVVEPPTEYGRLAWENPAATLRVTLDRVGAEGEPLHDGNVARRVLEVKTPGRDAPPAWLASALDDAVAAGDLVSLRRRAPTPAPAADVLRAVVRLASGGR